MSESLKERIERRQRIKHSRDIIVNINGSYKIAKLIPEEEFQKEYYSDVVYFHYGDEYIIFSDWPYTPERSKYFKEMLKDDCVWYAKIYRDLDGMTTQTSFKRL